MINNPELERLIHAPKVGCKGCVLLGALGFCQYYKRHRNYIVRCDILDTHIRIVKATEDYVKGTNA